MLARYRGKTLCPKCHGTRLKPEANYVRVGGRNISELVDLPITELKLFFDKLAELMKKEKLEVKHGFSLRINVRFIFCTTENLKELVQAGKFSEKLYLEISHHVISNPETIHNDYKAFIKFAFSGLSYYSNFLKS